jgi:sulfatase modifying factor 1
MARGREARGALVGMVALLGTVSCDAVFGIEAFEAGSLQEAGTADAPSDTGPKDAGAKDTGGSSVPDGRFDSHTNACTPGTKQCIGSGIGSGFETCAESGEPGTTMPCGGDTPYCYQGTCTDKAPSCAPGGKGMTNCGAGLESCCTSLEVPGGTFSRAYSNNGSGPTGKASPATVSGFRLDKYPVTVGRFRQFVNAWNGGSGYLPPGGSGKHVYLNGGNGLANSFTPGTFEAGWAPSNDVYILTDTPHLTSCNANFVTWTTSPGANENLPLNCVNWYEAYAFCIFDGGFLPSEAEWEFAAAGGNQLLEYPWGSTPPGTDNEYAIYGCNYPSASGSCTSLASLAPVGTATLGAGMWGQLDLAGEVNTWTMDWFATYVDPCDNCSELQGTSAIIIRGGAFVSATSALLPPSRDTLVETGRNYEVGLRCARAP